ARPDPEGSPPPQQYFIFIGAIHPRKNILNLLKAFELHKHSNSTFKLVLVGRNAWMNNEIHLYLSNMKYKTDVVWIEKITRKILLFLLKIAYALFYPSLFEG
ncbi:MAG TPA: glycosyltransferase, partial [Chitinophagales bacterium]|nr:glycosyltransferase [Chitinophagales bacterium]